jgi:hypothetical protein
VIVHTPRNADLSAPDQSLEPSSDIHSIAKDVALLGHHIADIDANPEAHPSSFRLAFVRPLKRLLNLDRTVHRVEHAHEFGEHAIPGGVRNPTSIPPDELVDYGAARGQYRHRRLFIAVHQSAVPLDIGSEDRSEMSLDRRSLHLESPYLWGGGRISRPIAPSSWSIIAISSLVARYIVAPHGQMSSLFFLNHSIDFCICAPHFGQTTGST